MPEIDGMAGDFDADPESLAGEPTEIGEVLPPSEQAFTVAVQRERTRSKIALYYVLGFMAIVCVALVISFYMLLRDKLRFEDLTNVLVTISGILSGPLGFIIGYYFKAESNND